MKELNPAKVAAICFVFLVILYLTSGVDLALATGFISFIILFHISCIWLFLSAFLFFFFHLIFTFIKLHLETVFDFSISSYLLFACGLALYFLQGQRHRWEIYLPFKKKLVLSYIDLVKAAGILLFIFLIFPLTDAYLAAIIGYIAFLVVFWQTDGRYAISIGLFFLILCPFLLISRKEKVAETSAIFTYYFLVVGVVQEIVNMVRSPDDHKDYQDEAVEEAEVQKQIKPKVFLRRSERIKMMRMRYQKEGFMVGGIAPRRKINSKRRVKMITAVIGLIIMTVLFYFLSNSIFRQKKTQIDKTKTASPTPQIETVFSPTPVIIDESKIASETGKLSVLIENGTNIPKLAASTAAILKKGGFTKIETGNAKKKDYKNWEITMKKSDENLIELIKKILGLEEVTVKEASKGAGFDIIIIAGEKK